MEDPYPGTIEMTEMDEQYPGTIEMAERDEDEMAERDEGKMAERDVGTIIINLVGSLRSNQDGADLVGMMCSIPEGAKIKEIFFYELIQNAVGALVEMRYMNEVEKKRNDHELFIHIVPDKTNHTLSIIDSGIGMPKESLVGLMGDMIPLHRKSKFMKTYKKFSTTKDDSDLASIYDYKWGFGLGFYSAYMVADKVVITTKQDNHDQYVWEFDVGCGSNYTITQDTYGEEDLYRGTKVTLFLREHDLEYMEECRLMIMLEKYFKLNPCYYPVYILGKQVKLNVLDYDDINQDDINQEEEGRILNVFKEVLCEKVKDVVLSVRYPELQCYMTPERTMIINPRSYPIEELKKKLEVDPTDFIISDMVRRQYFLSALILARFDRIYGTNYSKDAIRCCF